MVTILQRRYQNHYQRIEKTIQYSNKSSVVWRDTLSIYYIIIRHVIYRITDLPRGARIIGRIHVDNSLNLFLYPIYTNNIRLVFQQKIFSSQLLSHFNNFKILQTIYSPRPDTIMRVKRNRIASSLMLSQAA